MYMTMLCIRKVSCVIPGGSSINYWAWHVIECVLKLYSADQQLLVAYTET